MNTSTNALPKAILPETPTAFYTEQERYFATRLSIHDKAIRRISALRLASALVIVLAAYVSWYGSVGVIAFLPKQLWYGLLLSSLGIFLFLVTRHANHFEQRERAELMLRIQKRELAVLSGDFTAIPHGGEFLTERDIMPPRADDFALDLDVFGEFSLFQRMNRTVTPIGYKRLAEHLTTTFQHSEQLRARQQALSELSRQTTFRHEWMASLSTRHLTGTEQNRLQDWLRAKAVSMQNDILQKPWFQALLWGVPLLTIASAIAASFLPDSGFMRLFLAFGLGQLSIYAIFLPRIRRESATMSRTANLLAVYVRLFRLAQTHPNFQSPELQQCALQADSALRSMKKLTTLLQAFEMGQSFFGAILLNGVFLWDLQCISRMNAWRNLHYQRVEEWFRMLAEMDALVSMAGFVFNHPHFCQPTILDAGAPHIEARGLAHPFLPSNEAVKNSLQLSLHEGRLVVITGANMAGKSTFLRALALNSAMALMGLPVASDEFSISILRIVTSMRTTDSLERHESYFFAELQRLQMIVGRLRDGEQMLVVLDEILRGTNSADKKSGTIGLLRQFLSFTSLAVIATHDTEIGALEQEFPDSVRNFCFEGIITGDDLHFDYTLRSGVAHNKNATFLMQKMGILQVP